MYPYTYTLVSSISILKKTKYTKIKVLLLLLLIGCSLSLSLFSRRVPACVCPTKKFGKLNTINLWHPFLLIFFSA